MTGLPDLQPWLIAVLALATAVAAIRLALLRRWRLLVLQPLLIGLLAFALLWRPEPTPQPLGLLTPGASLEQVADLRREHPEFAWLSLPGAVSSEGVGTAIDLAAALRQQSASALLVVGYGLDAEQLARLGSTPMQFVPGPWNSAAIVELAVPASATPGQRWEVRGRIQNPDDRFELHLIDPSGASIDQTAAATDGRFSLIATAPLSGAFVYAIELRHAEGMQQRLPFEMRVSQASPMRGLLLAAAPSPELKFLRRWAEDAGLDLDSRIGVAPGLSLRKGNPQLNPAVLAELDLLLLDERSWSELSVQKAAVVEAVRGGLGLLIRLSEPPSKATLQDWQALGLKVSIEGEVPVEVELGDTGPRLRPGTHLHAWPIAITDAQHFSGPALEHSAWIALGQGRIGITELTDTYQFAQQGQADVHASLWAGLWQQLARPADVPANWQLIGRATAERRLTLCGGAGTPSLTGPKGERLIGLRDHDFPRCVAFWPRSAGRWQIEQEDTEPQLINVFEASAFESLERAERRTATQAYAATHAWQAEPVSYSNPQLLRALLLGTWLLLAGLVWWSERRVIVASN